MTYHEQQRSETAALLMKLAKKIVDGEIDAVVVNATSSKTHKDGTPAITVMMGNALVTRGLIEQCRLLSELEMGNKMVAVFESRQHEQTDTDPEVRPS